MRAETKAAVIIGAYVICAFLTFGHLYNTKVAICGPVPPRTSIGYDNWGKCKLNTGNWSTGDTLAAGIFWPGYWLGHVAIEITK